jgi:putative endonuclease
MQPIRFHGIFSWFRKWRVATPASEAGARGERLAAEWLRRERHFTVVARNWRNPIDERDEIDLVCRDRDVLVFVEVKTRSVHAAVRGFLSVNARKKQALRRSIQAYLARLRHRPHTLRLDVVEVMLPPAGTPGRPEVVHIENVPLFPKQFRA